MAGAASHERGALLLRAINGSEITVFYQGADLRYQWIENPPVGWLSESILGNTDIDIMPPPMAHKVMAAKRHVLKTRQNLRMTVEGNFGGSMRSFDLWIDPDLDDAGRPIGLLCTSLEITDLRRRENNLQSLLREVSHRSRNLLAIVQSIARQTVTSANSTDGFMKRFDERVQSIAHSLDVVTRREWDGATVHDLLQKQLGPFVQYDDQLCITGEDPILDANAALHVGLAAQELGSNAANHGAWSKGNGQVVIAIEALPARDPEGQVTSGKRPGDTSYRVTWTEDNIPKEMNAESMNFGGHTLRNVVPRAVNGTASLSIEDEELVYTLDLPPENFRP
ncbi:MAG: HWE histidine kinase domain-containing protein [Pseudomonadota bacterium]